MEVQKNIKRIFILSILVIVSLYIILNYNDKSTNQEVPKRATLVLNYIGDKINYG